MRRSSIVKKPIRKASKPREREISKKVVSRLDKNRKTTLRSHAKISIKAKAAPTKKEPVQEPEPAFLRDPKSYQKIMEIPVYEPTNEEFKEPFLLIKKLVDLGYHKYGCIKLKTPKTWNPEFSYSRPDKKLTTRKQILRDLIKGKAFEQNIESYTAQEFKEMADEFQTNFKRNTSFKFPNTSRANEYEFWALVEDPQLAKKKVSVEYAADLPTRRYGSAFPTVYKAKMTDELDYNDEKTHPFNLNNINHAKDSLFQIIQTKSENISGITSPWIYFGMLFASFCWHVEDLYMYSINYMHQGAPKTWYCIPPDHKEDFDVVIREKYPDLFVRKPGIMHNIVLTINPLDLVENNIPVYRTEQCPGDFIITFPKSYHAGFSHGFNISEAVNIASYDWIPFAQMAVEDYIKEGNHKNGSFPYEWLLMENVKLNEELDLTREAKSQLARIYEDVKNRELEQRDIVLRSHAKVTIRSFSDKLTRHDAITCMTCKNYPYLSYISCIACNKKVCTHHIAPCKCVNATVLLYQRFTDDELNKLSLNLKQYLPKKRGHK